MHINLLDNWLFRKSIYRNWEWTDKTPYNNKTFRKEISLNWEEVLAKVWPNVFSIWIEVSLQVIYAIHHRLQVIIPFLIKKCE